jgi:hypothetical protein
LTKRSLPSGVKQSSTCDLEKIKTSTFHTALSTA